MQHSDNKKLGWRFDCRLDRLAASDDFNEFIIKAMSAYPGGFLTHLYYTYARECTHIGKMENIDEDLSKFMREIEGVEIYPPVEPVKINESDKELKERAQYSNEAAGLVMERERSLIAAFNYYEVSKVEKFDYATLREHLANHSVRVANLENGDAWKKRVRG
jgi:hypothetical protein